MQLSDPNVNLLIIMPEIIIALTGVVVMLYDCFFPKNRGITGTMSLIGIAAAAISIALIWPGGSVPTSAWGGMIVHDSLRLSFSVVFLLVAALTILVSSVWIEREDVPGGEYHALLLFATFGMLLMSSAMTSSSFSPRA
ncbi:MAG: hypothetical protein IPM21_02885 [Acidobacteria bacterium]|nr:hypothetical protein [Acidobacteriota bacterium]